MRRCTAGFIAFLAMLGTLVVLPVYAAPLPTPEPVETSVDEVRLGSVVDPTGDAVVAIDGTVEPDGVDPAPAASPESEPAAPTTAAEESPSAGGTEADVPTSGEELAGVPALTVSRPETEPFSAVGLTWQHDPAVTDVKVQIRVRHTDGSWGEWTALEPDDIEQTASAATDENEVRAGTAPYWTGPAQGLEAIVQGADGAVPADVRVALVDPGTSDADALPGSGVQDQANAAAAMPPVVTRAQWGADETIRTWDPEYASTLKAATIHHTADGNGYTATQVPAMMRSIYTYHTVNRGWGDIGYNVIVDKFGRVFEGRYGGLDSTVIGAHAGGFNTFTFGVSMLGNYDEVPVPQATVDAISEMIAWKFGLYDIDAYGTTTLTSAGGGTSRYAAGTSVTLPTIFGHRDVGSTACPGRYGYARLGEIEEKVDQASSRYARVTTIVQDATTGNIPDVAPVTVAAVAPPSGLATVFVRGLNNTIWHRTSLADGSFSPWVGIPATGATSGPSVVLSEASRLHLVLRGTDNGVWYNSATLQSDGRPGPWQGWQSLGGYATSAPSIASLASDRLAVATRGIDGAVWQRVWTGSTWSPWASVGGYAYSAPMLTADAANSRYMVSVIGMDDTVWQIGTTVTTAGPAGPWVGGGLFSSHAPASNGASAFSGPTSLFSLGGPDHEALLLDAATSGITDTGGTVTSIAGLTPLPDGKTLVLGRGLDNGLWVMRYRPGQTSATWASLGGVIQ